MSQAVQKPRLKRALRDRLLALPAGQAIELIGPIGAGKRSLAQKLSTLDVTIAHQRRAPYAGHRKPIRLHPFTVTELGVRTPEAFLQLLDRGGFPEGIWGETHPHPDHDPLPRYLEAMLAKAYASHVSWAQLDHPKHVWASVVDRVGQTLSIRALAQSLAVSDRIMKGWVNGLEGHHGLFRLAPLQSPIAGVSFRSLKKDQKHYPYDWSQAPTPNTQLEALVANHLLHWVESKVDLENRALQLHYFRDCDQREVDFVVTDQGQPVLFIDIDPVIERPNHSLRYLKKKFPSVPAWHLALTGPMMPVEIKGVSMAHPLAFLHGLA